jgi:hypothetical protein
LDGPAGTVGEIAGRAGRAEREANVVAALTRAAGDVTGAGPVIAVLVCAAADPTATAMGRIGLDVDAGAAAFTGCPRADAGSIATDLSTAAVAIAAAGRTATAAVLEPTWADAGSIAADLASLTVAIGTADSADTIAVLRPIWWAITTTRRTVEYPRCRAWIETGAAAADLAGYAGLEPAGADPADAGFTLSAAPPA